jgi:hypothetical protein
MPAQVVELPQAALGQQIVNKQAAPAAKRFVVFRQAWVMTRFAAVETRRLCRWSGGRVKTLTPTVRDYCSRQTLIKDCAHTADYAY